MNRASLAIAGAAWVTLLACAGSAPRSGTEGGPSPAATSYFNHGKDVIVGADLRAARITGPEEFLPIQVAFVNRTHHTLVLDRESFVLVLPEGMNLPLASPEEFWRDYHRAKADLRMGIPFLENVFGSYPDPPFHWIELEFFPEKFSGGVPREQLELRFGEATHGYMYFRQPPGNGTPGGAYKLLVKPRAADVTYVLDFFPYRTARKAETGTR